MMVWFLVFLNCYFMLGGRQVAEANLHFSIGEVIVLTNVVTMGLCLTFGMQSITSVWIIRVSICISIAGCIFPSIINPVAYCFCTVNAYIDEADS